MPSKKPCQFNTTDLSGLKPVVKFDQSPKNNTQKPALVTKAENRKEQKVKIQDAPEVRAFIATLTKDEHPADEILYKKPETWTRDEMIQVKKRRMSLSDNDPRAHYMDERIQDWFTRIYSDKPAETDAAGRIREPESVNAIAKHASPATNADGKTLKDGLKQVGRHMATVAKTNGLRPVIKHLQEGLNMTNDWGRTEEAKGVPTLKEDGIMGPKTRTALKHIIAERGSAHTENALALARFHDYAIDGAKNDYKDLAKATQSTLGGLFRDPAKSQAAEASHPESLALQDMVNDLGQSRFGPDDYKPVKTDGRIGPKTTRAFTQVAKKIESEKFIKAFANFLSFW